MKKILFLFFLPTTTFSPKSQRILSLDSCRALAIANNKELLMSGGEINAAYYQSRATPTNYLPNFSVTGTYMRSQKEFSLLNSDQKAALPGLGNSISGPLQQATQVIGQLYSELAPILSQLGGAIVSALNEAGSSIVNVFHTDTRNAHAGAITPMQSLYMGGKIRAYNKITKYAEELARQQHNSDMQEVILSTDQAYWQVISLVSKKRLAESYLKLLQKLDSDAEKMITERVTTKVDGLSARAKVNEAGMTLTKAEDGLSLSRILLCQLCGIDLSTTVVLVDEDIDDIPLTPATTDFEVETVYANRPEIQSLEPVAKIYQ